MVDEKKQENKNEGEAKVEPIHPSEHERGGRKKSLLDTCK